VPISGVLLDVGGVFLIPNGDVVGAALVAEGITFEPEFEHAHFAGVAAFDEIQDGANDKAPYLQGYVRRLRVKDEARAVEVLRPLWEARGVELWSQVLSDSAADLQLLADRELRLGVVSNSDGTVEEQLLLAGVCQVGCGPGVTIFVVVDSAVVGVSKPDPAIFSTAVDALGLTARQVAYVGDSVRNDVAAASAAGLMPIHFDPHGLCGYGDHRHVARLGQVIGLLSGGW
jgi:putative hydrolase of the HAD superfamily